MLGKLKSKLMRLLPSSVAGRLRSWRIRRILQTFSPRLVNHTYGGTPLKVWLTDPLSQGWYDHDWPEPVELTALKRLRLKPGARAFDLGAHQGIVAMMIAAAVGPTGQVVAVEANSHKCRTANQNRDENQLSQLEIVQAAVSNVSGTLQFNNGLNGQIDDGTGAGGVFTVDALTIDQLAERYGFPDVIFLDIEGAELLAIEGAERVLATSPDCFIEMHIGCGLEKLGGSWQSIFEKLKAHYATIWIWNDADPRFRPFRADDPCLVGRCYFLATQNNINFGEGAESFTISQ